LHGKPSGLFFQAEGFMSLDIWNALAADDKPHLIIDRAHALDCPHCGAYSNITAVSTPRWGQLTRYFPKEVIVGYRCDACNSAIALRFKVFPQGSMNASLSVDYEELERPMETFEFNYLPASVANDFREALVSYSNSCLNATAAMCRRTIQSVATDLGAAGSDKVSKQIVEAKEAANIDDVTFTALRQIMLDGHDGSHPHLPTVTKDRAAVLIEIMKDALYQLYVRKAKIQEAMQLRQGAVEAKRGGSQG
jgi:hypothetical protein